MFRVKPDGLDCLRRVFLRTANCVKLSCVYRGKNLLAEERLRVLDLLVVGLQKLLQAVGSFLLHMLQVVDPLFETSGQRLLEAVKLSLKHLDTGLEVLLFRGG